MVVNKNINKIIEKYHEKKIAHAFLFETNDYEKCLKDVYELIKVIFCPNEYSDDCEECSVCHLIELNNLPSCSIIETDDKYIKKEQIINLKNRFQAKSIYTDISIYVIKEAEKLNKSASNTILKFLEEPDGQVIGIFLTSNKNQILETIRSRCQQMNISYTTGSISEDFHISEEIYKTYLQIILDYAKILETDPEECILKNKSLVLDKLNKRTEIDLFFKILFKIYWSMLENFVNRKKLPEEFDVFSFIKSNYQEMTRKLNIIKATIDNLDYNLNLELALDKFVMEMGNLI